MEITDEEICAHFGEDRQRYEGAVNPPIFQDSLFTFQSFESFVEAHEKELSNFVYSRGVNPTTNVLEQKLAKLEKGEKCKCFSSGMGAISATLFTLLKSESHVLFVNNIYGPTLELAEQLEKFNIHYDCVNNNLENIKANVYKNTKLIYIESPGTLTMDVVDLKELSDFAKKNNIITVIDNTWATPIFQKPLTLGIDLSIHSLTKYIGGHSDVVAGAVIGDAKLVNKIFQVGHQLNGAVLSPNEAYLLIRGMRTLPIRMKQHQENVLQIINYLKQKKQENKIIAIHHPSIGIEKNNSLIENQMEGFSGLLSFELSEKNNSFKDVTKFINALSLFKIGVSWGGYESLVTSPSRPNNESELQKQDIPLGLIRLSIGLEKAESQIEDLERGFNVLQSN